MIIILFLAFVGLFIGSFLNVVVLRLHAGRDFTKGRSSCPKCGHVLSPLELLPVVSWVALRGRCHHCKAGISIQYPLVELTTAIVFGLSYATHPVTTYGDVLVLGLWLYVASSLIVLAVYDLRWYLLPDKVLLPIIVPAVAILIGEVAITKEPRVAVGAVAAALLFGGGFYALAWVSKGKWMGGGDIKLAFVMGLLLGLQKTSLAMLIGFVAASIIGIALIATRQLTRKDHIPFGPFLILGLLIAYWFGTPIIHWYSNQLVITPS